MSLWDDYQRKQAEFVNWVTGYGPSPFTSASPTPTAQPGPRTKNYVPSDEHFDKNFERVDSGGPQNPVMGVLDETLAKMKYFNSLNKRTDRAAPRSGDPTSDFYYHESRSKDLLRPQSEKNAIEDAKYWARVGNDINKAGVSANDPAVVRAIINNREPSIFDEGNLQEDRWPNDDNELMMKLLELGYRRKR
jgi:hypothetical protein